MNRARESIVKQNPAKIKRPPPVLRIVAALLRAAALGKCSAARHAVLTALSPGTDAEPGKTVQELLSHDATYGEDALAGILWPNGATPPHHESHKCTNDTNLTLKNSCHSSHSPHS